MPSSARPTDQPIRLPGQRGPEAHEMRAKVVAAAFARFRSHGYAKTSVADLAADLGVTPAYIYKFFASKIAICEAVCATVLGEQDAKVNVLARSSRNASERLTSLFLLILKEMVGTFFAERKLYDMVDVALSANWASVEQHKAAVRGAVRHIVEDGMRAGEFAPDLDAAAAATAIWSALLPFAHPSLIEQAIHEDLEGNARATAALLLRGLRCR